MAGIWFLFLYTFASCEGGKFALENSKRDLEVSATSKPPKVEFVYYTLVVSKPSVVFPPPTTSNPNTAVGCPPVSARFFAAAFDSRDAFTLRRCKTYRTAINAHKNPTSPPSIDSHVQRDCSFSCRDFTIALHSPYAAGSTSGSGTADSVQYVRPSRASRGRCESH